MFDLLMSTFPRAEVLKDEKDRNFCSPIVNQGAESLDKEDRDSKTASYSSTRKLLLEYMKDDGGRVWSATRSAKMDV